MKRNTGATIRPCFVLTAGERCGTKRWNSRTFFSIFFECERGTCGGTSPERSTLEEAYKAATKRASCWISDENHVLTLEELQERRETTNTAIPCELRMKNGKSRVAYIAPVVVPLTELYADGWQYKLEEISAEHRTEIYYNGNTVLSHILPSPLDYGVKWRCWLRYPEKFEREETPWEES